MNETADNLSAVIAEAEAYCAEAGIKLSTLGQYALGNKHWFRDRQAGRPCLNTSVERVRQYITDQRAKTAEAKSAREAAE